MIEWFMFHGPNDRNKIKKGWRSLATIVPKDSEEMIFHWEKIVNLSMPFLDLAGKIHMFHWQMICKWLIILWIHMELRKSFKYRWSLSKMNDGDYITKIK
jgi:hypothetical protein